MPIFIAELKNKILRGQDVIEKRHKSPYKERIKNACYEIRQKHMGVGIVILLTTRCVS